MGLFFRTLATLLLTVILLAVALVGFELTTGLVSQSLVNRWLALEMSGEDNWQLDCVEWAPRSLLAGKPTWRRLCVSGPGIEAILLDVVVEPPFKSPDIRVQQADVMLDLAELTTVDTASADNSSGMSVEEALPLALAVPALDLQHLNVRLAGNDRLFHFTVDTDGEGLWHIQGDLIGNIQLSNTGATGSLEWEPAVVASIFGVDLAASRPLLTEITLVESQLDVTQSFDWQSPYAIEGCEVRVSTQGKMAFTVDINNWIGRAVPEAFSLAVSERTPCLLAGVSADLVLESPIGFSPTRLETEDVALNWQGELSGQLMLSEMVVGLSGDSPEFHIAGSLQPDIQFKTQGVWSMKDGLSFRSDNTQVSIPKISYDGIALQDLQANLAWAANADAELTLQGQVDVASLKQPGTEMHGVAAYLRAQRQNDLVRANVSFNVADMLVNDVQATNLDLKANITQSGADAWQVSATSRLERLVANLYQVSPITGIHEIQVVNQSILADHILTLYDTVSVSIAQQQAMLRVSMPKQTISGWLPLAQQFLPGAELTGGEVSAQLQWDLISNTGEARFSADQVTGSYNDYRVTGLTSEVTASIDDTFTPLLSGFFSLDQLYVGIDITGIRGYLRNQYKVNQLVDLHGQLFDGRFMASPINLDREPQHVQLDVIGLNAEDIVALEGQAGITFRTRLSGELPLYIEGNTLAIQNGRLYQTKPGKLRIVNNVAFDALKSRQAELGQLLSVLEDMDIKSLNTDVSLSKDGWMELGMKIKGFNPYKKQEVNFNYNHEENIFMLLKALRMGDMIADQFTKELQ